MLFIILAGVLGAFAAGYFLGRHVEERSNIKEIEVELDKAMEEEHRRLVQKATENLQNK